MILKTISIITKICHFDMNILITDQDWGGCGLDIDFKKIDILPRITLSDMVGSLVLNIGFLMLTFNLYIYSSDLREFNRKLKSGELEKELQDMLKKMETLLKENPEESAKPKE
jgi:hypothetical protein